MVQSLFFFFFFTLAVTKQNNEIRPQSQNINRVYYNIVSKKVGTLSLIKPEFNYLLIHVLIPVEHSKDIKCLKFFNNYEFVGFVNKTWDSFSSYLFYCIFFYTVSNFFSIRIKNIQIFRDAWFCSCSLENLFLGFKEASLKVFLKIYFYPVKAVWAWTERSASSSYDPTHSHPVRTSRAAGSWWESESVCNFLITLSPLFPLILDHSPASRVPSSRKSDPNN